MNASIAFAISSMFFAGLNDLLFKKYVAKNRSRGIYIAVIGLIWSLSNGALWFFHGSRMGINQMMLGSALLSGFTGLVANIMLLQGLKHIDASVGSTIYRLNFIVVTMLALIFLDEPLTIFKAVGLMLAIVSVFLISGSNGASEKMNNRAFLFLVVLASLLRGVMGFFYKIGTVYGADINMFLFINGLFWAVGGPIYFIVSEKNIGIDRTVFFYGTVSGLLCTGITSFLFLSVAYGEAIVAVPITQLSFVVTTVLSLVYLKEELNRYKIFGIICAVGAIFLLAIR